MDIVAIIDGYFAKMNASFAFVGTGAVAYALAAVVVAAHFRWVLRVVTRSFFTYLPRWEQALTIAAVMLSSAAILHGWRVTGNVFAGAIGAFALFGMFWFFPSLFGTLRRDRSVRHLSSFFSHFVAR